MQSDGLNFINRKYKPSYFQKDDQESKNFLINSAAIEQFSSISCNYAENIKKNNETYDLNFKNVKNALNVLNVLKDEMSEINKQISSKEIDRYECRDLDYLDKEFAKEMPNKNKDSLHIRYKGNKNHNDRILRLINNEISKKLPNQKSGNISIGKRANNQNYFSPTSQSTSISKAKKIESFSKSKENEKETDLKKIKNDMNSNIDLADLKEELKTKHHMNCNINDYSKHFKYCFRYYSAYYFRNHSSNHSSNHVTYCSSIDYSTDYLKDKKEKNSKKLDHLIYSNSSLKISKNCVKEKKRRNIVLNVEDQSLEFNETKYQFKVKDELDKKNNLLKIHPLTKPINKRKLNRNKDCNTDKYFDKYSDKNFKSTKFHQNKLERASKDEKEIEYEIHLSRIFNSSAFRTNGMSSKCTAGNSSISSQRNMHRLDKNGIRKQNYHIKHAKLKCKKMNFLHTFKNQLKMNFTFLLTLLIILIPKLNATKINLEFKNQTHLTTTNFRSINSTFDLNSFDSINSINADSIIYPNDDDYDLHRQSSFPNSLFFHNSSDHSLIIRPIATNYSNFFNHLNYQNIHNYQNQFKSDVTSINETNSTVLTYKDKWWLNFFPKKYVDENVELSEFVFRVFGLFICSILIFTTLFGNILTIIVVLRFNRMKTVTNILLAR